MRAGGARAGSKESLGSRGSGGYSSSAVQSVGEVGNSGRRPSQTGASSLSPRVHRGASPGPSPRDRLGSTGRTSSVGVDPRRERRGSNPQATQQGRTVTLGAKHRKWLVKVQAVSAWEQASKQAKAKAAAQKEAARTDSKDAAPVRKGSKEPLSAEQASWRKMMQAAGCKAEDYERTPKAGQMGGFGDGEAVPSFGDLSGKPAAAVGGKLHARKVAL